jgi:hypothetical protein
VEIKAAAAAGTWGQRKLFDFSMKVYIKQPGAAAEAASGAASGASKRQVGGVVRL